MTKSDGVKLHHIALSQKERLVKVHNEKKSEGVRVHHEKERWGESSP